MQGKGASLYLLLNGKCFCGIASNRVYRFKLLKNKFFCVCEFRVSCDRKLFVKVLSILGIEPHNSEISAATPIFASHIQQNTTLRLREREEYK